MPKAQDSISRRSALAVIAGGASLGILPLAVEASDPVLPLARRRKMVIYQLDGPGGPGTRLYRMLSNAPGYKALEDEVMSLTGVQQRLEEQMLETEATTFAGVIEQLEVADSYPELQDCYGLNLRTIISGLRKLVEARGEKLTDFAARRGEVPGAA
jgi:hypothetical protein